MSPIRNIKRKTSSVWEYYNAVDTKLVCIKCGKTLKKSMEDKMKEECNCDPHVHEELALRMAAKYGKLEVLRYTQL